MVARIDYFYDFDFTLNLRFILFIMNVLEDDLKSFQLLKTTKLALHNLERLTW